jgi:hypothetical protein
MADLYEGKVSIGPMKIAGVLALIALLLLTIRVFDSPGAADPVEMEAKGHSFRIEKASRGSSASTENLEWNMTYPTRRFKASPQFTYDLPLREKRDEAVPSTMYASLEIEKGFVEKIVFSGNGGETAEITLTKKFSIEKGPFYMIHVDGRRFLVHVGSDEELYFLKQ